MFPEKATLEWKVRKRIVLQKLDREIGLLNSPEAVTKLVAFEMNSPFEQNFNFNLVQNLAVVRRQEKSISKN